MALGTGCPAVHGSGIGRLVHVEGDRVPGHRAVPLQKRIPVAGEAVFVGGAGIVEDPTLLVGLVAVHTGRDLVRLLLP